MDHIKFGKVRENFFARKQEYTIKIEKKYVYCFRFTFSLLFKFINIILQLLNAIFELDFSSSVLEF